MNVGATLARWRDPLFSKGAGRLVIQLPFDDSLDSTHDLECFFVMPTAVKGIKSARVWVARKDFRAYETAAASGAHSHGISASEQFDATGTTVVGDHGSHGHTFSDTYSTVTDSASHSHGITYGIYEQAAAGTLSLYVADDGTNYGSAIIGGVTAINDQSILSQLTKKAGAKRIKITSTGLCRVQVTLVLDLNIAVFA